MSWSSSEAAEEGEHHITSVTLTRLTNKNNKLIISPKKKIVTVLPLLACSLLLSQGWIPPNQDKSVSPGQTRPATALCSTAVAEEANERNGLGRGTLILMMQDYTVNDGMQ